MCSVQRLETYNTNQGASRHTQEATHQSPRDSATAETTEKCVTCALDASAQSHETLQTHDTPEEVWSKIGMDIFTIKNKDYLILVDYFSDFSSVSNCQMYSQDQSKNARKLSQETGCLAKVQLGANFL